MFHLWISFHFLFQHRSVLTYGSQLKDVYGGRQAEVTDRKSSKKNREKLVGVVQFSAKETE